MAKSHDIFKYFLYELTVIQQSYFSEKVKSCNGSVIASNPVSDNGLCRSTVTWNSGATGHTVTMCISAG